jgi:tetratricopeptide (TPR) repeat protein
MSEQQALIEQWVHKAEDQYHDNRYEESLISAQKAISIDEGSTNPWWFYALSLIALGRSIESKTALEKVIVLSPYFANGWAKYGAVLQVVNDDLDNEDAKSAFEEAISLEESHLGALTSLAGIMHRISSDDVDEIEKEIVILDLLNTEGGLTSNQLNRLGGLHYRNKNFFEAIKVWERNVNEPSSASLFKLGLAFNHPEVSQDADAIDIWRLTLKRKPDYEKAQDEVNELLPRLVELSESSRSFCDSVLNREQCYLNYLNPFQLLNYQTDILSEADILDFKNIQRLKKRLLQEIELEDGCIHWLSGAHIDKSKAISLCDELHDKQKIEFHRQVYNNKPLLRFLSLGEHAHFCVDRNHSPLGLIEYLDDTENGFREWLSGPFSRQFNLVLSSAVENKYLYIIEVLLDGRRWVSTSFTEACFVDSKKIVSGLASKLAALEDNSKTEKPVLADVLYALNWKGLLDMLNCMQD